MKQARLTPSLLFVVLLAGCSTPSLTGKWVSTRLTGTGLDDTDSIAMDFRRDGTVSIVDTNQLAQRLAGGAPAAVLCFEPESVKPPHVAVSMPRSAEPYAARLYDALRIADASGLSRILIEWPQETHGSWTAILDRLRRATGRGDIVNEDH